jgi:phosphate uptake regulator
MRRKLIKQGMGGYTITLPIKWVRELNLEAGTELDVKETDEGLLIAKEGKKKIKEIFIEIKAENKSRLRTVISSAYRRGYDKVTIKIANQVSFVEINSIVDSLIGFVITDQTENKVIIKNIMNNDFEGVSAIIKKLFITVSYYQKEIIKYLKHGGSEAELKQLKKSIIKLRDYAQRSIHLTNFEGDRVFEYNTLIFVIEKLAGNFADCMKKKIKLDKYVELFSEIQSNLFKKDLKAAIKLTNKLSKLRKEKIHSPEAVILDNLFSASSRVVGILI